MNFFECVVGSGGGSFNTLIVTCDEQFAGKTITCTDGTKTFTQTCPSTAPYTVTFDKLYAETWTVSGEIEGTTFSETIEISDTFTLQILAGFDWRTWVDTARFLDSSDYDSLDEVLADELAVRELCLEHACVDYLAAVPSVNADIETIINNDLFAKWVNNSDYSLDILGANVAIKALMDAADKYGYGEWVITDSTTTPPTWGPKGNVPVMTSNTAPYGEAIGANVQSANPYYYAFDGNDSTVGATTTGGNIGYKFVNPVCVKRVLIWNNNSDRTYLLEASNDNSTYTLLETISMGNTEKKTVDIDNDNYYLYYRIRCANDSVGLKTLQFYGRELSVSVPVMTANNAPYGEVTTSSENARVMGTSNVKYRIFAHTTAFWFADNELTSWFAYQFTSKKLIKMVMWENGNYKDSDAQYAPTTYTISGSNDNGSTWEVIKTETRATSAVPKYDIVFLDDNVTEYSMIKVTLSRTATGAYNGIGSSGANFYGLDYSEKEFEEGTTKKWLYDHGVELETLRDIVGNNGGSVVKNDNSVSVTSGTATSGVANRSASGVDNIDVTPYSLMHVNITSPLTTSINIGVYQKETTQVADALAAKNITSFPTYQEQYLDISQVNQIGYVACGTYDSNHTITFDELWLE